MDHETQHRQLRTSCGIRLDSDGYNSTFLVLHSAFSVLPVQFCTIKRIRVRQSANETDVVVTSSHRLVARREG